VRANGVVDKAPRKREIKGREREREGEKETQAQFENDMIFCNQHGFR